MHRFGCYDKSAECEVCVNECLYSLYAWFAFVVLGLVS